MRLCVPEIVSHICVGDRLQRSDSNLRPIGESRLRRDSTTERRVASVAALESGAQISTILFRARVAWRLSDLDVLPTRSISKGRFSA